MAEQKNPYAAPSAPVDDVHADQDRGELIRDGQSVPAGRGWEWWRRGLALFLASPWMWMLVVLVLGGLFVVAAAIVAALALLAAATGFCSGCEAYKLGSFLLGRPFVSCPLPQRAD